MEFARRLLTFRTERKLTQLALAEQVGVHVSQLRRYEAGTSQPTLDVLRKLTVALRVSADALLFGQGERGPAEALRFQFEAASRLDAQELEVVKSVLEGILLQHEARKLIQAGGTPNQRTGRAGEQ